MSGSQQPSPTDTGAPGFPTAPGSGGAPPAVPLAGPPVVPLELPLAGRVTIEEAADEPEPIPGPGTPAPLPGPLPFPVPPPPFTFCQQSLRGGCYALSFQPLGSLSGFQGTLRVDRSAPDGGPDNLIVSGDLYRRPFVFRPPIPVPFPLPIPIPDPGPLQPGAGQPGAGQPGAGQPGGPGSPSVAAAASTPGAQPAAVPLFHSRIPVFPRSRYHSYLKVISVSAPFFVPPGRPCTVTLVVEQYDYTHPAPGTFQGSFPATASRTVTVRLTRLPAPPPFAGPVFTGRWIEAGVDRGLVTLSWVSSFFRRASLEIDTLVGAVAPEPVPDGAGGTEYFDTIYAKHGWELTVVRDQRDVPVPAGVTPTDCWSSGNLHNLMASVRQPGTNLDTDWPIHLVVVPAQLGCFRGVMYDTIDVPREGCASFSDDGYPSSDSTNFGAAENQMQRNIPRAYLRSATHEVTHTFNQIHQEIETVEDNSIMTTTPSVADVLGGPATGEPGVFPDQINLAVNATVRHHLDHMPDPVIRPGGWPFSSWFGGTVPQAADRHQFDPSELELTVTGPPGAVVLGQPVELSWTLTNRSGGSLVVPNDVRLEGLFASMTIIDADGVRRPFRPYVIACDTVKLAELEDGGARTASHRVFWSSDGFAFPRPGPYRVAVAVAWSARGVPVGIEKDVEVFVEFPTTGADNEAAGLVMTTEVGKWVALGGGAYHLTEATSRLEAVSTGAEDQAPRLLAGFEGLLPDPDRAGGNG